MLPATSFLDLAGVTLWGQAQVSPAMGEFGVRFPGHQPNTRFLDASDAAQWPAWRRNSLLERLEIIHSIPKEEKLWCIQALEACFAAITKYLKSFAFESSQTQAETGGRGTTPHLFQRSYTRFEPSANLLDNLENPDKGHINLAFEIIGHVDGSSKLAVWLCPWWHGHSAIEQRTEGWAFVCSQDVQTWGFEVCSTKAWAELLARASPEELACAVAKMLRACKKAKKRLKAAREELQQCDHQLQEEPLSAMLPEFSIGDVEATGAIPRGNVQCLSSEDCSGLPGTVGHDARDRWLVLFSLARGHLAQVGSAGGGGGRPSTSSRPSVQTEPSNVKDGGEDADESSRCSTPRASTAPSL